MITPPPPLPSSPSPSTPSLRKSPPDTTSHNQTLTLAIVYFPQTDDAKKGREYS